MGSSTFSTGRPHALASPQEACRMCGGRGLREAGEVGGYRFVECDACAFVFAPSITQAWLDERYAAGYHGPEEGAPEDGWQRGTEFLRPALERLPQGPLRILDFGAGQSRTPERLRALGHRVVAIDVAPPLRPHPDRVTGSLLDARLPIDAFDLVYSYQVLEHLPEPRPHLERLLELTRPGGLVLVHTDMEMPERERGFDRWWYVLPPDHCAFYRHRTFERFVEGTPHAVVFADAKRVVIRAWAEPRAAAR